MHKTIYIELDEEITSVLDKIRDEKSSEICIVAPKNATLTQGIINLKLLKKEAAKYGKTIVIATNDPQARKVIKRLEIKTQEIAETDTRQDKKKATAKEIKEKTAEKTAVLKEEQEEIAKKVVDQTEEQTDEIKAEKEEFATSDIGSETFFDGIIPESIIENETVASLSKTDDDFEKTSKSGPVLIPPEKLEEELFNKKRNQESKEESFEVPEEAVVKAQPKEFLAKGIPAPKSVSSINKQAFAGEKQIAMNGQAKTVRKINQVGEMPSVMSQKSSLATTAIPKGGKTVVSRSVDFGATPVQQKKGTGVSRKQIPDFDMQKASSPEEFKVTEEINLKGFNEETSKKAEEFFGTENRIKENSEEEIAIVEKEARKSQRDNKKGFFRRWGFAIFIFLIFAGVGGFVVWGYSNYPQAEIVIYPRRKDFSKEIKITVKEGIDKSQIEEGVIPGQYKELTIKKTMKFNATGETYATDDGKAKGKVTIYNNYSEKEQPLVATTRVLSKEGKLFRLAKGVTVPGMVDEKPGTVEVAVIADKPGEEYNIGSTTFTIEGFKGNSKYTKFEVKSFEEMTDGGSPDTNKKLSMISTEDIDRAREKTITALEKGLEEEVQAQLGDEMSAMFDSVEKEIISGSSTNEAKDIVKSFSYTIEQKIKLIVFETIDVNSVVLAKMREDIDDGYELEESQSEVTFKKSITDFENKTMTMYLDSAIVAWPSIETEELAQDIADKKEEEIKVILMGYPTIEKIEFLVKPSWLTGLPISKDKIDVKVIK